MNEVVCHGVPDKRKLRNGDIVNINISVYKHGLHSDLNETYYCGSRAKKNPEAVNVVETAREALDLAVAQVRPGMLFRKFGEHIENHAHENQCSVVRSVVSHGINNLLHCPPYFPNYHNNDSLGSCRSGMTFTLEPMLNSGSCETKLWPDNWTCTSVDGRLSAKFEHTVLVTDDGVEVLTKRNKSSPGCAIPRLKFYS